MYEILIVDDDAVDRRIARRALSAASFTARIDEAATGEHGLGLIRQHGYDCLLLDLILPDMDGIGFLRRLAALDRADRPAVVMLTGAGNERIAVEAMKLGVQDYLIKGELSPNETEQAVLRALVSHREAKVRDAENSRLMHMALVDSLTGLGNRNAMEMRLDQALRRSRRSGEPVCLLLLDLNGFKAVNDNFGHLAGDHLLKVVAERLRQASREVDTVVRLGGDEFVIVMETGVTREGADVLSDRIVAFLAEPVDWNGTPLRVGCSIGKAFSQDGRASAELLLSAADKAMYRMKRDTRATRSDSVEATPKQIGLARS